MKVGDYVRTIYGIKKITDIVCGQDIRFDNTDGFDENLLKYHDYDGISKNSHTWEEIVIGEPKEKPIDLIEVGDYVNGCYVTNRQANHNEGITIIPKRIGIIKCNAYFNQGNYNDCEFVWLEEKDIKSIVTKEQFSQMEYKVEG